MAPITNNERAAIIKSATANIKASSKALDQSTKTIAVSLQNIKVPIKLKPKAEALFSEVRTYAKELRVYCQKTIGSLRS